MQFLNLKAMNDNIKTSNIYTTPIANSEGESKDDYTSNDQVDLSQQWGNELELYNFLT